MITQTLKCAYCGQNFGRTGYPSIFTKYKLSYCSKRFALLGAREGYRPTQGIILAYNGHLYIRAPWHPNSNKNGQVSLANILMEQYIGRILTKDEVVHHIDGNPLNNIIENLQLMTISEHVRLHNSLKRRGENGQFLKNLPKMREATCAQGL